MRKLGLLELEWVAAKRPAVYIATRRGHRAADLDLPLAKVSLPAYEHQLGMADLLVDLEQEFGREPVMTEREIRLRDQGAEFPQLAIRRLAAWQRGAGRVHYPDLIVLRPEERRIAIELERTVKARERLEAILRSYVRVREVETVRYYVTAQVEPVLKRAVERTRCEDFVEVRLLTSRVEATHPPKSAGRRLAASEPSTTT